MGKSGYDKAEILTIHAMLYMYSTAGGQRQLYLRLCVSRKYFARRIV